MTPKGHFEINRALASTLLNQLKLVYRQFGQSNMHSTLDFCLRPARKETNLPLLSCQLFNSTVYPPTYFPIRRGVHSTKIDFSTVYPPKKAIRNTYCFFGGVDSSKTELVLCTAPKKQYVRGIAFFLGGGVDSTKIDMCKKKRMVLTL